MTRKPRGAWASDGQAATRTFWFREGSVGGRVNRRRRCSFEPAPVRSRSRANGGRLARVLAKCAAAVVLGSTICRQRWNARSTRRRALKYVGAHGGGGRVVRDRGRRRARSRLHVVLRGRHSARSAARAGRLRGRRQGDAVIADRETPAPRRGDDRRAAHDFAAVRCDAIQDAVSPAVRGPDASQLAAEWLADAMGFADEGGRKELDHCRGDLFGQPLGQSASGRRGHDELVRLADACQGRRRRTASTPRRTSPRW